MKVINGRKSAITMEPTITARNTSIIGSSNEVMALDPLRQKWEAFGWSACELDGHDLGALVRALRNVPDGSGKPVAIVAHTVKGKGIPFMEDDNNWHYRSPDAAELRTARAILGLS